MGLWRLFVDVLVVGFALFFTLVGIRFLGMAVTGIPELVEPGVLFEKVALGLIFLLAAAPMFYYVIARRTHALPSAPIRPRHMAHSPPQNEDEGSQQQR